MATRCLNKSPLFPGVSAGDPARRGRGWQRDAGPADAGACRQQGRGQPGQGEEGVYCERSEVSVSDRAE